MTSRKPTKAMQQLWLELRELGVNEEDMPTARTLENWQKEGLISTDRVWLGRGQGSQSQYRPGTAETVIDLIAFLKTDRSFVNARLVLFYRGHEIEEVSLKQSYVAVLKSLTEALKDESIENKLTQRFAARRDRAGTRRRIRDAYPNESTESLLGSIVHNIRSAFLGDLVIEEGFGEVAEAHGVPNAIWKQLGKQEQVAAVDSLDLGAAEEIILGLSMDQLRHLRNAIHALADSAKAQQDHIPNSDEIDLNVWIDWNNERDVAVLVPIPILFISTNTD